MSACWRKKKKKARVSVEAYHSRLNPCSALDMQHTVSMAMAAGAMALATLISNETSYLNSFYIIDLMFLQTKQKDDSLPDSFHKVSQKNRILTLKQIQAAEWNVWVCSYLVFRCYSNKSVFFYNSPTWRKNYQICRASCQNWRGSIHVSPYCVIWRHKNAALLSPICACAASLIRRRCYADPQQREGKASPCRKLINPLSKWDWWSSPDLIWDRWF